MQLENNNFIYYRTQEKEESMENYERKYKNKEAFNVVFSTADLEGNLIKLFDGGKIQLNNEEINGKKYDPKRRAAMLSRPYTVIIKDIDKGTNTVYVSFVVAKNLAQEKYIKQIEAGIQTKQYFKIKAYITKVQGSKNAGHILVNIGGVGIEGVINSKEWSVAYTSDLRQVAKEGDVIEVMVIGKQFWNGKNIYSCSRRAVLEALDFNPWKDIEKNFPRGAIVNVKCISLREKNFFGSIQGLKEINAYCEYPEDKNIRIIEGMSYQGFVAKVSEETKLLRVRIFKAINIVE